MDCKLQTETRMLEKKKADRYMDMVNNLESYLSERSFNEKLVQQELVEYVEVSLKNGNIHVCFRCDDKFQQIIELIEGVKSAEEREAYLRLSLADGDLGKNNKDESNSIENQRTLLVNFLQDRDDLADEYRIRR